MNNDNRRKVKILLGGFFEDAEFEELEKNDIFKLYEPDGKLVGAYKALADAYMNIEHNVEEVPVEPLSEGDVDELVREANIIIETNLKSSRA